MKNDNIDELRRALTVLLPALALAPKCEAQDAPRIQGRTYGVPLENDKLRVLEFNSRPGTGVCGSGMHSHPPHLVVALTAARVRVKLSDGRTILAENKAGDVFWSEGETHETENLTGRDVRALIIELKPNRK